MKRGRAFGCEFEFSSEWDECVEAIRKIFKRSKLYVLKDYHKSKNNHKWHLKTDSTTSAEVASPVSYLRDLPAICKAIRKLHKLKVTRNDGFHVHVWAKDVDRRALVATWLTMEKAVREMFPAHRRNNTDACFSLFNRKPYQYGYEEKKLSSRAKTVADLVTQGVKLAEEHHAAFSLAAYDDIGTVEFRLAEGTLDPELVNAWTRFCIRFVDYAKGQDPFKLLLSKPNGVDFDEMMDLLKVPEREARVLRKRRDKFTKQRFKEVIAGL